MRTFDQSIWSSGGNSNVYFSCLSKTQSLIPLTYSTCLKPSIMLALLIIWIVHWHQTNKILSNLWKNSINKWQSENNKSRPKNLPKDLVNKTTSRFWASHSVKCPVSLNSSMFLFLFQSSLPSFSMDSKK